MSDRPRPNTPAAGGRAAAPQPTHVAANENATDHHHWEAVEEATELLHEERFQEALVALRDVLEQDPRNPYGFYFLGIALFELGRLEASRDAYRAALKLAPQHLGARISLTHVLRQLGDLREALKEGTAALSQAPGDPEALHAIGLVYLARGDKTSARRYLDAFLETGPELEVELEVKTILEGLALDVDLT